MAMNEPVPWFQVWHSSNDEPMIRFLTMVKALTSLVGMSFIPKGIFFEDPDGTTFMMIILSND